MNKFYKPLPFSNFDSITDKIKVFIRDQSEQKTISYKIDVQELLYQIPDLKTQIEQYNFSDIDVARILITSPDSTLRLHNDGNNENPKFLALNWPLLNCANTVMRWFDAKILTKNYEEEGYGIFDLYDRANSTLLDQFEIVTPTIVNIQRPHDVVNNNPTTRIMLSLRFKEEPIEIFNS